MIIDQFKYHDEFYTTNKDSMLDWEVQMIEKNHRANIILSKVEEKKSMDASVKLSGIESRAIYCYLYTGDYKDDKVNPCYGTVPHTADEILSILGAVSLLIDNMDLYEQLSARSEFGNFHVLIGYIYAPYKE